MVQRSDLRCCASADGIVVTAKTAATAEAARMLVRLLGAISLFLLAFLSIGRISPSAASFAAAPRLLEPSAPSPVNARTARCGPIPRLFCGPAIRQAGNRSISDLIDRRLTGNPWTFETAGDTRPKKRERERPWTSSSKARSRSSPAATAASARRSRSSWHAKASTSPSSRATRRRSRRPRPRSRASATASRCCTSAPTPATTRP